MDNNNIINETISYVKQQLEKDKSGHDWYHIERVYKLSAYIAKKEGGDLFTVNLASLLHDIKDHKFTNGDSTIGADIAAAFLSKLNVSQPIIDEIREIIMNMSFKGGLNKDKSLSLAGKIVQDADRLDAIGAIGIARTFTYGGNKNRVLFDPSNKPKTYDDLEAYLKNDSTTINHFYEKLLKLKDLMNTKTAKEIAEKRHQFMLNYLKQFYKEWDCIDFE